MKRRGFIAGCLAFFAAPGLASATGADAQSIVDRFTSVKTMSGRFVQFGPRGDQSEGRFMLERPGKVRFDYDDPSPLRLLADGRSVAVGNRKLGTWDLYPLAKTPLKLLLDRRINLSDRRVRNVEGQADLVSVTLADPDLFGNATVEVMFDRGSGELRQWTVTDAQRKQTSVVVYEVREGVSFKPSTFRIPYSEIRTLK